MLIPNKDDGTCLMTRHHAGMRYIKRYKTEVAAQEESDLIMRRIEELKKIHSQEIASLINNFTDWQVVEVEPNK